MPDLPTEALLALASVLSASAGLLAGWLVASRRAARRRWQTTPPPLPGRRFPMLCQVQGHEAIPATDSPSGHACRWCGVPLYGVRPKAGAGAGPAQGRAEQITEQWRQHLQRTAPSPPGDTAPEERP